MKTLRFRHSISGWAVITLLLLCACGSAGDESGSGPAAETTGGQGVEPVPADDMIGPVVTPTGAIDEAPTEVVEETSAIESPAQLVEIENPWLRLRHVSSWTGDLDGMLERGVVRLLVVPSRTWFFLDGARQRGLSVATANALEEFLNKRFKKRRRKVHVLLIPVRRDELLPALNQGLGDIAGGNLTITPARRRQVDFTDSDIKNVRELVVTSSSVPPILTPEDLSGREIWVRESSSYYESLHRLNVRLVAERGQPVRVHKADENLEDEDLLDMVNAGLLPATVIDSHKFDWVWGEVYESLLVHRQAAINEGGEIGVAMRKNSPQLLEALNDFLESHGADTRFGDAAIKKYFSKRQMLRNLSASREMKKFDAVDELFEKYATQYDFDYLMLMAQGYQESRLDQSARSHVGAIGIMQVMPETAGSYPLFVDNIDETEPNIHAGIKYMRYIVDEHIDDPDIDPVDRLLFAFASYNAGPNRIARIRRKAAKNDIDPNVWFGEVEMLVAAEVGQEPVQYVRNIYKYYLAYMEVRDQMADREQAREN
jgi:membrane-bound lytic murein transglycosylase MltF